MGDSAVPGGIDTSTPHPARIYDYFLGGKDNHAPDRAAAEQIIVNFPDAPLVARQNRDFMRRTARVMAADGIRQFLPCLLPGSVLGSPARFPGRQTYRRLRGPVTVLDSIDLLIAQHLAADPRATYHSLACLTGRSRAGVTARVLRLVDTGSVRFCGMIHPAAMGKPVTAELLVDADLARVRKLLGDQEHLRTTPAADQTLVRVQLGDDTAAAEFTDRLRATGRVQAFLPDRDCLPPFKPVKLDQLDRLIVRHLAADPRASYATLSRQIGISDSATRLRVLRLLDAHAVLLHAVLTPPGPIVRIAVRAHTQVGLAVSVLGGLEGVLHIETGSGDANIVAYLSLPDQTHAQMHERLRTLGEVEITPLTGPIRPLLWPAVGDA